jgi:hypothetical protein
MKPIFRRPLARKWCGGAAPQKHFKKTTAFTVINEFAKWEMYCKPKSFQRTLAKTVERVKRNYKMFWRENPKTWLG